MAETSIMTPKETKAVERKQAQALKPCPWCGGEDLRLEVEDIDGWIAFYKCGSCDAIGPIPEFKYDDKAEAEREAITAWNTRSPDTVSMEKEGWQPIETAPKDETTVDLWLSFPAHEDREAYQRRAPDSLWNAIEGDWHISSGFHLNQLAAKPQATHWRPLPAPPIVEGAGK